MKLELACSVIGEGQVFLVKIEEHQRVYELKKKVQREIADLAPTKTRAITLYLAKNKDKGSWLPDNNQTEKLVKKMEFPRANFHEMRSSFQIKHRQFCFASAAAEDGLIHVLVELDDYQASQNQAIIASQTDQESSRLQIGSLKNQAANEQSRDNCLPVAVVEGAGGKVVSTTMSWWESIMFSARFLWKHSTRIWNAVTSELGEALEAILRVLQKRFMDAFSVSRGCS